jgi:hypothetical protein
MKAAAFHCVSGSSRCRLTRANGDDPLPSLRRHYTHFIATTEQSVPNRRIGISASRLEPLAPFSLASPCRFSRSVQEPGRASRRLHAGCRLSRLRHPPSRSQRKGHPPVLTSPIPLSTLLQRFACARLSRPRLPESCPGVSATLTTTAFDRSSLRWLEIST